MTDDLVKRLRILSGMTAMVEKINFGSDSRAMSEAADRIQQLEAALRLLLDNDRNLHKSLEELFAEFCIEARKALEWEK